MKNTFTRSEVFDNTSWFKLELLQQELDQIEGQLYELQMMGGNDEKLVDRRRELQKQLRENK